MAAADREITRLARSHHGVVATWQLREIGVSASAVGRRVEDGRLVPVHRSVYSVGPVMTARSRWMAAVLALGPEALLSHRDAGALHDLRSNERKLIDVMVPGRGRRPRAGITVHATRALHPDDRSVVDGIPVTSIPRTLLGLAELLPSSQLRRAYERAERLRLLDVTGVQELLQRSNGRRGSAALRALLPYDASAAAEARSELELRFLDLMRETGLPAPQLNVLVEGFMVDAYWPSARLVVELQSYAHHSDRDAFESDHMRFARLKRAGYEALALTWRQVTREPANVEATIRTLLGRSGGARLI